MLQGRTDLFLLDLLGRYADAPTESDGDAIKEACLLEITVRANREGGPDGSVQSLIELLHSAARNQ